MKKSTALKPPVLLKEETVGSPGGRKPFAAQGLRINYSSAKRVGLWSSIFLKTHRIVGPTLFGLGSDF